MANNNDSGQFPKRDSMYHLSLIKKLFFRIQKLPYHAKSAVSKNNPLDFCEVI